MLNGDDIYASNNHLLKAEDLQGKKITLTIGSAAIEQVGDDTKIVLKFDGKEKGLALNKTNYNTIKAVHGKYFEKWADAGVDIKLYPTTTNYQGKMVACIRVELPVPEADGDDTIPF